MTCVPPRRMVISGAPVRAEMAAAIKYFFAAA
jgi:hypothetical protein